MASQIRPHEPGRMTLREQWDFMTGPLHAGVVCRVLHYASLPLFVWGAASGRLWLILIGLVPPALGHLYDRVYRFDESMGARARQVVWLQLVATIIVLVPLYFLYLAFWR